MNNINVYMADSTFPRDFRKLFTQIIDQLRLHSNSVNIVKEENYLVVDLENFTNLKILDCELLIEYNGAYKAISLADFFTPLSEFFIVNVCPQRLGDVFLVAQGNVNNSLWGNTETKNLSCKVLGGIYVPQEPDIDFDFYRKLRTTINKKDMFVFKGNVDLMNRSSIYELVTSPYYSGKEILTSPDVYFKNVIEYKVGLCIPGIGEICYRDIEYMAMGIPMMKFEYMANLSPKLEPNIHYISIPRIDSQPFQKERVGGKEYANLYIQRFLEVKDDSEFLEYISKNAMDYYDTYLHPTTRVKHIFDLWELPFYQ